MKVELLISGLYAAANGRAKWSGVLDGIAAHLDLWLMQIATVDMRTGVLLFTAYGGRGGTPESSLDYVRFYNTIDPRMNALLATPSDQWMLSSQHHDSEFVQQSRFYQEFLIPHGGGAMAGTKVLELDNMQFMLAMVRAKDAVPLDPDRLPFMHQLKHHLGEAFRNMLHLRETYAELDMARDLLGQFDYPMLLVDEVRGLWHRNASAAALLGQRDLIEDRSGFLVCRRKEDDEALTRAVHALRLAATEVPDVPARLVLTLRSTDDKPYLAFVSAVRPHQTMGAFGMASRALIVLHDLAQSRTALDPFIVAECFDLTPAEARIAVQIADGANAKVIARRSGAALPTVRTHIKRIMEKTGVDRQADLIRLLLNLPVRAT